jgi:hypothetical protein
MVGVVLDGGTGSTSGSDLQATMPQQRHKASSQADAGRPCGKLNGDRISILSCGGARRTRRPLRLDNALLS